MKPLGPRERETLQLIADGFSNPDVAVYQTVTVETVKTRVRRILWKLNARTRAHAVAIALRRGEIE